MNNCRKLIVLSNLLCAWCVVTYGQQPRSPQLPAPPPMRVIPPRERTQLDDAKDPKERTKCEVELAQAHLSQAEQFTSQGKFEAATEQLGYYLALIEDSLHFLSRLNSDKGRVRDLYRHLDIALRAHIPRLSLMRRSTPAEYAVNIKAAEEYDRDARGQALDSFYGPTSTRDETENKKSPDKFAPDKSANEPPRTPNNRHP
jgi:hypothetical protein